MSISKEKNILKINGNEISFINSIDTIVEFSNYCIVLLMDDDIPDNNVEAYDYHGTRVWNISSIITFAYPESYISLSKVTDTLFSVVSYNGVKFIVNTETNQIESKNITK